MTIPCRVLMVYPKFVPDSFWNYTEACELVGAKYPAAPLGLITVASMLPNHLDIHLVNRNTEPLTDSDLDWADLVMIGGMLNQQPDFLYLIDLAHLHGKPVCVGGPDVSSSPHLYAAADFQVIGEAAHIIEQFIASWHRGERNGMFIAEKFKVDVTLSPMPRYDLINFDHYLFISSLVCNIRVAARSLASSAILSSCMVACHAPRPPIRFSLSCKRSTITVITGMLISSTTISLATRRTSAPYCRGSKHGCKSETIRSSFRPKPRSISQTTASCYGQ